MKRKPIEEWIIWKGMERIMRFILIACSITLVVIICIAVFMRYCLAGTFFGSDELITLLAMWLYWVGGAYGCYEDSNISGDLTNVLIKNKKVKRVVQLLTRAATAIISGFFAVWSVTDYGIRNATLGTTTTALHMPYFASNLAITVGFVLMFVYSFYQLARTIWPRIDEAVKANTAAPALEGEGGGAE